MAEVLEKQYAVRKIAERQETLLELAHEALQAAPADQAQVTIYASDSALTRFANSEIHQNTFEREATATVKARIGQSEGCSSTNHLTKEAMQHIAEQAAAAAKVSQPNPDLADFPAGPQEYPFQVDYFEATAATTPEDRANKVVAGLEVNSEQAFTSAGTLSTSQVNVAIVNSRGIAAAYNTTMARYTVLWSGPDSSGYRESTTRDIRDIDVEELSAQALATAMRSANPDSSIPAGKYTVVLGSDCIATMLNFLAWLGFSGKDYVEGSSFICGKMGEQVTGPDITIVDDPLDERTLGLPCDAAGVPK
ncbi:hypothetical protein IIA79_06290, partial [bacterium]|nr:hypothetical protein [bacterium]